MIRTARLSTNPQQNPIAPAILSHTCRFPHHPNLAACRPGHYAGPDHHPLSSHSRIEPAATSAACADACGLSFRTFLD